MTPLPTTFKKHGHTLEQVWRNDNSAIYHWKGGYEVIKIKKMPERTVMGRRVTAREVYPGDGEWGKLAISCPNSDSLEYLTERAAAMSRAGSFAAYWPPYGQPKSHQDGPQTRWKLGHGVSDAKTVSTPPETQKSPVTAKHEESR